MKKLTNKVKQDNLVFIALIYNYIGNNKNSLSIIEILNFIRNVDKSLNKTEYEVSEYDVKDIFLDCFGIKKDKKNQRYIFKHIDNNAIAMWYDAQPIKVLAATLNKKALESIGVAKEDLQTKKEYVQTSGMLNVYSLHHESAICSATGILEDSGCQNIEIISATPDQLDGDKGYHVQYRCNRPYEKANILVKKANS